MSYHRASSAGRGRGGHRGGRQAGPQLPTALMAEVDPAGANSNRNRGRPRGTIRPAPGTKRDDVRASLREFNNAHRPLPPPVPVVPPPKAKRPKPEAPAEERPRKKKKPELTLPGRQAVDAEDGEIEWLEYMLKKEKAKDEMEDGLDELLGFADLVGPGGSGLQLDDNAEQSEDEDLDALEGEDSDEEEEDPSHVDSDSDNSSMTEEDDTDVGTAVTEPQTAERGTSPVSAIAIEAEASGGESRYVPPHMRAAQLEAKARGDKAKELERNKLERKIQGVLNKLSEANMETMLAEIEGLYKEHSRNDVSSLLTDSIVNTIANRSNLLDSFVILYATLVGALHRILGMGFGAHFVHATIAKYRSPSTDLPATTHETPDAGKSPLNLLTLIAELYNAQVIGANLIYDLIRSFLTQVIDDTAVMTENQVESLLRLLRCSGQQLRSDDPASLKDIANLVQEKTKGKEKTMTTRARYMIETLVDLKSGKQKSTQNTDADAAIRMKRFITGIGRKRRVATTEPLRVSLQDFIDADTRGKWWLVGAGWAGNPLVEREKATSKASKVTQTVEDEEVLLEAARSQGMNTDVRRSVFVILMTSEDYIHACDRLSLLKFTEIQQREFVRVTIHCCATEKAYNPYHTLIINKLCSESYSHRFTFQYALWDFLRELGDENGKVTKGRCRNVASAAAYVVARGSLDLTVFKAIDFTSMKAASTSFFAVFLSRLFLATQTSSPLFTLPRSFQSLDADTIDDVFQKALVNLDLARGLTWILRRKGAMDAGAVGLGEREVSVVAKAAKVAAEVLSRAV